jgi:hypothetical protein
VLWGALAFHEQNPKQLDMQLLLLPKIATFLIRHNLAEKQIAGSQKPRIHEMRMELSLHHGLEQYLVIINTVGKAEVGGLHERSLPHGETLITIG